MAYNTKRLGSITELRVMAKLMEYGDVSVPYGDNARYDCILDWNGRLLKIQIKTARRIDDNRFLIPFANTRSNAGGNTRKSYSVGDVDYIATDYQGVLYLFPTGNHINEMYVSFDYPKNGLRNKINLACNYLAEKQLGILAE